MVCQVRVSGASSLSSAPNQRRSATKLNTPLHLILEENSRSDLPSFSWTDVPRMRLQLKILFGIKALPILKKRGKTCWGGGRSMSPPPPFGGLNLWHVTGYRKYSVKFIGLCSWKLWVYDPYIHYQQLHQFRVVFSTHSGWTWFCQILKWVTGSVRSWKCNWMKKSSNQ